MWTYRPGCWKGGPIDLPAREGDVRVAIEMHPHNLVFSPVIPKRLVEACRRNRFASWA